MVQIISGEETQLSAEQQAAVQDGAAWVADWYQVRKDSGNYTELPEQPEFDGVMSRLDNIKVIVADDMYTALEQALERGDLHFRPEIIALCGSEEMALEALKAANQSKRGKAAAGEQVIGGISVSKYVTEPAIVLNGEVVKDLKPEELESLIVHETTHAAEAQTSELMLSMIHGDVGTVHDAYADNPREMYARLMQLRHHFKLPADKECTVEDVARMREECTLRHDKYKAEHGEGAEVPEFVDFMMFDRYADEEILMLLNYTADNGRSGNEDRTLLAGDMRRDAVLSQAKGRAFERSAANKGGEIPTKEEPQAARQTRIDGQIMARLAERSLT